MQRIYFGAVDNPTTTRLPCMQGDQTALLAAVDKGPPEMVEVLLQHKANTQARTKVNPAKKGDGACLKIG